MTVEKNGSGWKVATILGALLCCAVGVIAGSSTIYLQHVTWAANKTAEVDIKLAVASSERFSLRADVNQVVLAVDSVASRMDAMTRAMERLADSNCYRDTGKPCSRTMLDERP